MLVKMKLLIFYLTNEDRHYTFPHFVNLIKESKYKNLFTLLILTNSNDINYYKELLENTNIISDMFNFDVANNYLKKVNFATEYAKNKNIPFMMKCDNDIFLKTQTLDYMIENLEMLNDDKNLTLGPTLTSGIPGVEYFIEQFFDEDAKFEIEKMFLQTKFYDHMYGASYSELNKYTLESAAWNKTAFFDGVKNLDEHYKGIHPIRVNENSIEFLNNYIVKNKHRFNMNYHLEIIDSDDSPYLCNSIFCIKTETYNRILNDNILFVDSYDEVPLNKYCWENDAKHLFVKNGFAIHMYYNWKKECLYHELEFCNKFFKDEDV
jgi:hypothetical protein